MNINDTSDATKITYYTPRTGGFQAGYSWVPEMLSKGSVAGSDDGDSAHEFAVDYSGKIGGGRLQATLAGSVMTGDTPDDGDTAEEANFGWRAGITYAHGPWTIAAGYKDAGEWSRFDESGDHTGWDVGVAYSGGSWEVALVHIRTNTDDNEGDLVWDHSMLTGAYNLGGGLSATMSLNLFDLHQPTEAEDHGNSGKAIMMGINAAF
jgi:predicted porin